VDEALRKAQSGGVHRLGKHHMSITASSSGSGKGERRMSVAKSLSPP
jgi:hypothetical protein